MTEPSNVTRYAWIVVALLFPVALLNYLDRQMLATMKSSMVDGHPEHRQQGGLGDRARFLQMGLRADESDRRLHRRSLQPAACDLREPVRLVGRHLAARGTSRPINELIATRAFMGVSEAFYIPAALALITDFHRGQTRSRAVGVHQTGIYAGSSSAASPVMWRTLRTMAGGGRSAPAG